MLVIPPTYGPALRADTSNVRLDKAPPMPPGLVVLETEWVGGLPIALARSDDKAAPLLRMILDTGAFNSYLRSTQPWKAFRIAPRMPVEEAITLDLADPFLDALQKRFGTKIDGILGRDVLDRFRLGVDPEAREVVLVSDEVPLDVAKEWFFGTRSWRYGSSTIRLPWSYTAWALTETPLRLKPLSSAVRQPVECVMKSDMHGAPQLEVSIDGTIHRLLLDLWSEPTLVDDVGKSGSARTTSSVLTPQGWVEAVELPPHELKIGPVSFGATSFLALNDKNVLGRDVWSKAKWLIDYSDDRAYFAPYDEAVNKTRDPRPVVHDVIKGYTFVPDTELKLNRVPGLFQLGGAPPSKQGDAWFFERAGANARL